METGWENDSLPGGVCCLSVAAVYVKMLLML